VRGKLFSERLFTSGGIMVRCNINLDNFCHNYRIATAFSFASEHIIADVKSCVFVFFTSGKIEIRCKTYFIFLFTSAFFLTDVKPLLISHNCTKVANIQMLRKKLASSICWF
jgi:hypothetical protein